MKLVERFQRFLAPNDLCRRLYPSPDLKIKFRPYEEKDRAAVIDLHDSNAPGRFPENHRSEFESFIERKHRSFFVVESAEFEILACCGVVAIGDHVNTLYYGLVSPRYQGRGIGSAMTLARLEFATRHAGTHFSFIFAVPKSMGFYERFGYRETDVWRAEDGKDYPAGVLAYSDYTLRPIAKVLRKRGHLIDLSLPIDQDENRIATIEETAVGRYNVAILPKEPDS